MKTDKSTRTFGLAQGTRHERPASEFSGTGIRGVITLLTRLFTTEVKAAPITIPTARSTTLPRKIKDLKPPKVSRAYFPTFPRLGRGSKDIREFLRKNFYIRPMYRRSSNFISL